MKAQLIFAHAITPLHAGTGQGVGVIDLPIAREKATGIPYFPGSSLKGALRDTVTGDTQRNAIFGPDRIGDPAESSASLIQITDLRLLLLPIRSLAGTFAWVTSPYLLRRLSRDARDIGMKDIPTMPPELTMTGKPTIFTARDTALIVKTDNVYLEDLDFTNKTSPAVDAWSTWLGERLFTEAADRQILQKRLAIVHDDVLTFLLTTGLEISARIRLDDTKKTVIKGGLWYEEALPAESVLTGMLVASGRNQGTPVETILTTLQTAIERPIQLGGKATVGRGMCQVTMTGDVK